MITHVDPALKAFATPRQIQFIDCIKQTGSLKAAGKLLGADPSGIGKSLKRLQRKAFDAGYVAVPYNESVKAPKILLFDIETSPLLAYCWSIWHHNIPIDHVFRDWHILTWAARWLGEEETMFDSMFLDPKYEPWSEDDSRPVKSLWKLLDEADWVVGQNSDKFDIKKMNTRFLLHDLGIPSPYRSIDTLKIAKNNFAFTSNKLDYMAQKLLGFGKVTHEGHKLWRDCLAGVPEAWETMKRYNIGDIDALEGVYLALRPWHKQHPSFIAQSDVGTVCTVCGSPAVTETGKTVKTMVSEFKSYQCEDCGHHMRSRKSLRTKKTGGSVKLINAS